MASSPKPAGLARSRVVETTFKSVDATVAGQWDFPVNGSAPLIVLIPPTGKIDRNGWPPGSDDASEKGIYEQLADALVAKGFAVFRYDVPGAGRSSPGRWSTPRSSALEAYTRAVDHARIDPQRVFLLGHSSGSSTIAAIFSRFQQVNPLAGVILLANTVGEREILEISVPILVIVGDKYPDDLYQHGRFVADARTNAADRELETTLVSIEGADHSILATVPGRRGTRFSIDPRATDAIIKWLLEKIG